MALAKRESVRETPLGAIRRTRPTGKVPDRFAAILSSPFVDGPTTWPRWRSNVERSLRGHAASLLATRFADLGLPAEGQLAKVIAFNVGIELGQATAIFAMFVIGVLVAEIVTQPRAAAEPAP